MMRVRLAHMTIQASHIFISQILMIYHLADIAYHLAQGLARLFNAQMKTQSNAQSLVEVSTLLKESLIG